MFEMEPVFLSILGAPACGKSYFLASMTWQLRKIFPKHFCLAFGDADPQSNRGLNEYEELQFLNSNRDALVTIEKTEVHGDLYDTGLKVVVPAEGSPLRADLFGEKTQFMKFDEFKKWLDQYKLTGS